MKKMKKTYIYPKTVVTLIQPSTILGGSIIVTDATTATVDVDTSDDYDGEFCSRRNSVWGDDDEE